jgi:hypothetical protein
LRVVKGDVQIKSAKTGQTTKARIGQQVDPQDIIITGKESRAKIVMVDNNEINVSPESQIEIQHYQFDPNAGKKDVLLNVIYGKVRAKVEQHYDGKTSKFQIKTPSAVAGVRGTDFMTSYNRADRSSQVVTFRGAVEFGQPGVGGSIRNSVSVTPGMTAHNFAGNAPSAPVHMPKGEFAKMDNETKAEGAGSNTGGNGNRQPSGDNGNGKKSGDNNGASNTNGDSSRAPASTGPKGGMIEAGDTPSGGGTVAGPNTPPPPPPPPATVPGQQNNTMPTCDTCKQALQQGNTKVLVHVNK